MLQLRSLFNDVLMWYLPLHNVIDYKPKYRIAAFMSKDLSLHLNVNCLRFATSDQTKEDS